ncbi:MAG: hypothetical protein FJY07_04615 [Bacteroidetes bacterium]|nr:hypothetical protein [Bacteroidota bacterium]
MRFAEVIGHEAIKQRLVRTVKENRVSHAQLFLGKEGTGNLPLAIAYAQFINCTDKTNHDSCGVCPSCVKYSKLAHPDLHLVFPYAKPQDTEAQFEGKMFAKWREAVLEKNGYLTLTSWYEKFGIERKQGIISAADCNQIIKKLSYRSYEADYSVVIIWMVEKLYYAAAPKLLKILEEPPEKTLFLLIAANHELIIKTIISRTQIIKIPAINDDDLIEGLSNGFPDQGRVRDAVKISEGNYIAARQYLQKLEESDQNIQWFSKWMRICFSYRYADILDFVSEISKQSREGQKSFLSYALRMIRQSLLISAGSEDLTRLNTAESDFVIGSGIKRFYPYVNVSNSDKIYDLINQSIYHIERNGQSAIIFFDLSLKLGSLLKAKPV